MGTTSAGWTRGACRSTATAFGVLAGLGGLTHGIGEVLQGSVPVEGIWLESWTTGPIAEHMGGEPGITVLPTALAAGLVTLVASASVLTWSVTGMRIRHGGSVLSLLSAGMLLAGGGVGPPVLGMLAGAVGRWGLDRQPRWMQRLTPRARRELARAWPAVFVAALVNGVFLVVGSVVLVYTAGLHMPGLFTGSFFLSVALLLVLLVVAPAYDAEHGHPQATADPARTTPSAHPVAAGADR